MFHGSIVALATPMLDGKIDEDRLRALVAYHLDMNTKAIVVAGTTGESGTLTLEEKLQAIKVVVQEARESIYVIAGTGETSTAASISLTQQAMNLGVHAALVMAPPYIKPTQEGLYQHFSAIAHAAALPIILYNVPSRTASDILPETVTRLACISNIIGIKEATGDIARLEAILEHCGERMDVYSGDDLTAAEWMLAGAKGVISVTANVAPMLMAKLCATAADRDSEACMELQERLMPLHQALFIETNPIPVKWAMCQMGLISEEIRLPLTPLAPEHQDVVSNALRQLGL